MKIYIEIKSQSHNRLFEADSFLHVLHRFNLDWPPTMKEFNCMASESGLLVFKQRDSENQNMTFIFIFIFWVRHTNSLSN